jgi:hypothetical protein
VDAYVDEVPPALEDGVVDVLANYTAFSDLLRDSQPW